VCLLCVCVCLCCHGMQGWFKMKRVRTFEVSPRDVIEQATKVLSALKLHTPPDALAGALQGSALFSSRQTLSED